MTHQRGKTWVLKKNWDKLESMEGKGRSFVTGFMLTYLPMIEVVDSVNNWCSLTLMTRWMSHEALAFMRVMADLRWMSGLGKVCWFLVTMRC